MEDRFLYPDSPIYIRLAEQGAIPASDLGKPIRLLTVLPSIGAFGWDDMPSRRRRRAEDSLRGGPSPERGQVLPFRRPQSSEPSGNKAEDM